MSITKGVFMSIFCVSLILLMMAAPSTQRPSSDFTPQQRFLAKASADMFRLNFMQEETLPSVACVRDQALEQHWFPCSLYSVKY
ncbi:hypothetical protein Mapa_006288 [Marchantia paleacea]|nr:hypothetical protein Mapa_006288 [Marchantia paleacea]